MDCHVIHSTEGRLRIRVPFIADNSESTDKLNWLVESLNFVTSIRINPSARSLIVTYETNFVSEVTAEAELLDCIRRAGNSDDSTDLILPETKPLDRPQVNEWEQLGLPTIALGLALVAAPLEIPPLIIGAAIASAAVPWFSRATESLVVNRQPNVDLLDSLWMTFHNLNGQYVAPSLKTALVGMRRTLRGMSAEEKRQFQQVLNSSQQLVWVEREGEEKQIPDRELVVGDRVIVYPGSVILVDGQILQGTALIDERHLTGNPQPVVVTVGEDVYASSQLLEGKLCIQVKRIGENTRIGLALGLLQAEPVYDTQIGTQQAEFAKSAVVPTIFLGASIFALTGMYGPAITPFQLDFGSGIQIAMPTAFLGALTAAARNGVYIRSGRVLEVLAQIDTIVFDRTGTLTQGDAAVTTIYTAHPNISPAQVLTLAATAEASLNHPVAKAIARAAETQGIQLLECETWDYMAGLGTACRIDGQEILVGSDRLLQQHHVDFSYLQPHTEASSDSYVYVAKAGIAIGIILYTDSLRPESADIGATLQGEGINIYVMTEDNPKAANHLASQLGIAPSHVHAHATSENKAQLVQALCHHGKKVAFIGDGINEAAVLSFADVSVSFATSSDIQRETADVVLLDRDLNGIVEAIALAKRAMEIVYQNAAIAIVPNLAVVTGGIFFGLNPAVNVVTNNFTAFLAEFFNSTRPLLPSKTSPRTKKQLPQAERLSLKQATTPTFGNGTTKDGAICIKQSDLAKRLGLSAGAIARHRAKPEFSQWSSTKDPEGIAWIYDPGSKSFCRLG